MCFPGPAPSLIDAREVNGFELPFFIVKSIEEILDNLVLPVNRWKYLFLKFLEEAVKKDPAASRRNGNFPWRKTRS
jgi:hypothetical protein